MRSARGWTTALATLGVLVGGVVFASAPAWAAEQWAVVGTFGGASTVPADPAPLSDPTWVAVNQSTGQASSGDVYVVDKSNDRVEWFDSAGKYEGQFNGSATPAKAFSEPEGIAVDSDPDSPSFGDVYVIDSGYNVIDKFSASGHYEYQLTETSGGSTFGKLLGVAVDSSGKLLVSQAETEGEYPGAAIDDFSSAPVNQFLSVLRRVAFYSHGHGEPGGPGLAFDSEENLFYLRGALDWVEQYNIEEGEGGFGQGEFGGSSASPETGFTVERSSNNVYIDVGTSVAVINPAGSVIESFGGGPLQKGEGVVVDSATGEVYVAESASDTVFIFEHSSMPQVPPPPPTTEEAKAITGTTATLHGELNPESIPGGVGYHFSYNAGAGSSCTGPGSVGTSFDNGTSNVTGDKETPVSATVKGLEPDEEYVFCLVADRYGASAGLPMPFTTLVAPPEVISESASNIGPFEGVFAATINPNNSTGETTYSFEFSTEGSTSDNTLEGTIETIAGSGSIPPGEFGERPISSSGEAPLSERAATYYYRVVATNATGTTAGKVQAYTKLPIIAVGSEDSSALTLTEATLKVAIQPNYQITEYHFEYATKAALLGTPSAMSVPGAKKLFVISEDEAQSAGVVLSGLEPNTTYYYRVVAENESTKNTANLNKGAPVADEVKSFTTRSLPFVSTGGVQNITRTTATLSGTVNSRFVNATYYFAYIDQDGYEQALAGDAEAKADPYAQGETTVPVALDASEAAQAVGPIPAGGLLPGETYHYALVSRNEFGVRYGEDHTFTTLPGTPPIVSTGGVSGVNQNSATLSGTVDTNSLQTEYGFEIATEPGNYGPATGLGSLGGALTQAVGVTLGELQPGTTYHYRVTATNADGTTHGSEQTFTTPGFPTLLTTPASPPLIVSPTVVFPSEEKTTGTVAPKVATNAQKLASALKGCRRDTKKAKRAKCERQARNKYAPAKKKKGKK